MSQQDSVLGMAAPPVWRKQDPPPSPTARRQELCKTASLAPPATLVSTRENPQASSAHCTGQG